MTKRFFTWLGPNNTILIAYFLLMLGIFAVYGVKFKLDHFKLWSVLLSTLFAIYFTTTVVHHVKFPQPSPTGGVFVSFLSFAFRQLWRFISDWFPLVALVTIYENLREYTGIIRTDQIDAALMRADIWLFGVEPTVWIQQFTHPILTEYFAFTYSLYLVLPLALGWYLYACKHFREYHTLTTGVILCLCIGYLLYLTFPAGPPRFFIPEMFDPPQLVGYFGFYNSMQARFDAVNPMMYRASFPSLHVGLSSVALYFAVRYRNAMPLGRLIQVVVGVIAVSLWIATVYLRHHWVVDIFAGWAVALFACMAGEWVQKR
jgi:membrane-associated phospholipid phosphatase